jgi:hypothetical protein
MSVHRLRESRAEHESWKSSVIILDDRTQEKIRRLIDEAVEDMYPLDHEILEIEQRLRNLKRQREKEAARIATLRAAISRVKKIPPELLAEIFMHISPFKTPLPPTDRYPWILGHVCTHWRHALWTTPSIWNKIRISKPPQAQWEGRVDDWRNILRETFKYILSQTSTLISLFTWNEEAVTILDILISHNQRFRNLEIHHPDQGIIFALMSLPRSSLQNLEKLDMTWKATTKDSTELPSSFETAPNLRRVFFTSPDKFYNAQFLLLPWEQLTEVFVTCMGVPPTIIHTTLQRCQALVKCQFLIGTDTMAITDTSLTLPTLEMLELIAKHSFDWSGFIQPFITPCLKILDISALHIPLQTFISLIVRSGCTLDTISFYMDEQEGIDEFHYESFLGYLSTVTSFYFSQWVTPVSIVTKIHHGLLPLVTRSEWRVRPAGLEAFLDVINTRFAMESKLTERNYIYLFISCLGGPGLAGIVDDYRRLHEEYQRYDWLDLTVINEETGLPMEYEDEEHTGGE